MRRGGASESESEAPSEAMSGAGELSPRYRGEQSAREAPSNMPQVTPASERHLETAETLLGYGNDIEIKRLPGACAGKLLHVSHEGAHGGGPTHKISR
jgi:hypothetical protein